MMNTPEEREKIKLLERKQEKEREKEDRESGKW